MALIDKASLLFVPSVVAQEKAFNILPSGNRAPDSTDQNSGYDNTRADFSFDRGSNAAATRVNSDGLIEKYRENFLTYSNNLNGSDWGATRLFSITNGHSGYNGSNDAWLIIPNSSNNTHYANQVITSGNGVQTISVYAKASGYNYFSIRDGSASDTYGRFDLATQTTSTDGSNAIESKMVSVGNDWYRCSLTLNRTAGGSNGLIFYVNNVDSNKPAYVGDEVSGVYFQDFQLESGMVSTDVLTSGATTGKAGVLIDLPRINYDANGENGSLLLEPSRQQLFQYSEWFDNTYWARTGTGGGIAPIVTQNYAISPEGFKNASRVQFDTNGSTSTHRSGLVRDFAFTTGDKYAISCWVKSASGSDEIFAFRIAGAQVGGEKTATNEWQLFTETHTATATTTDNFGMQMRGNYSSQTSDILIYGMQLENATYGTSYIPNHGESGGVTRAADSCSVTGVSDVIGQTEGTIFVDVNLYARDSFTYFALAPNLGTTSSYIGIGITTTAFSFEVLNSGVQVAYNYSNSSTGNFKIAFAYKANDFVGYVNGTQVMTDTSGSVPACSQIGLNVYDKDQPLLYKQVALFNERLSNAELATLTTL